MEDEVMLVIADSIRADVYRPVDDGFVNGRYSGCTRQWLHLPRAYLQERVAREGRPQFHLNVLLLRGHDSCVSDESGDGWQRLRSGKFDLDRKCNSLVP